jgi:hypothetical protein
MTAFETMSMPPDGAYSIPRSSGHEISKTHGRARAEGEGEMTGPRPAGRAWTPDDDMLRKLLASGMKAPAIALKMNRTVGAIQ